MTPRGTSTLGLILVDGAEKLIRFNRNSANEGSPLSIEMFDNNSSVLIFEAPLLGI